MRRYLRRLVFFQLLSLSSFSLLGQDQQFEDTLYLNVEYKWDIGDLCSFEPNCLSADGANLQLKNSILILRPQQLGTLKLQLTSSDGDSLHLQSYVDSLPLPLPGMYRRTGAFKLSKEAVVNGKIEAENICHSFLGCGLPLAIENYKVRVFRNDSLVENWENLSKRHNQETILKFAKLKVDDLVEFYQIMGTSYYGDIRNLGSLRITIQ